MSLEKLNKYIEESRKIGKTDEIIKQNLLNVGWDVNTIDSALNNKPPIDMWLLYVWITYSTLIILYIVLNAIFPFLNICSLLMGPFTYLWLIINIILFYRYRSQGVAKDVLSFMQIYIYASLFLLFLALILLTFMFIPSIDDITFYFRHSISVLECILYTVLLILSIKLLKKYKSNDVQSNNMNITRELKYNKYAIISVVSIPFVPIAPLIFGILGLRDIKNTGEAGKIFCYIGIILGALPILITLILFLFTFLSISGIF